MDALEGQDEFDLELLDLLDTLSDDGGDTVSEAEDSSGLNKQKRTVTTPANFETIPEIHTGSRSSSTTPGSYKRKRTESTPANFETIRESHTGSRTPSTTTNVYGTHGNIYNISNSASGPTFSNCFSRV